MLRIHELRIQISPEGTEAADRDRRDAKIRKKAAGLLHVPASRITGLHILRHGIDARKKPLLYDVYTVDVSLDAETEMRILAQNRMPRGVEKSVTKPGFSVPQCASLRVKDRPVIVGAGPAGLFCALTLAEAGVLPILLERGDDTAQRDAAIERFREGGTLDPESNIQFGMGGAGTYSDGKLYTGIKDPDGTCGRVLETLVTLGAPEDILYEAHPHIGTDVLRTVMTAMRARLEKLGVEIRFRTRLDDLEFDSSGALCAVKTSGGEFAAKKLVLATGHSARDTIESLYRRGIVMEQKAFAVGFRVAHPQVWIDQAQYGRKAGETLPPAVYKLTTTSPDGRGVYSFCMCPGGRIVNASSEQGMLCVNGMSERARDGAFANSAIVTQITPDDYRDTGHPLEGMQFQREMERRAFRAGDGRIPVMMYGEFASRSGIGGSSGRVFSGELPDPSDAFAAGYQPADLTGILPDTLAGTILSAMRIFGDRIRGYDDPRTLFAGVESRTSSPVRIPRNGDGTAPGHAGIYPCGEGAGYAGGITSAAVDGIRTAGKLIVGYAAP